MTKAMHPGGLVALGATLAMVLSFAAAHADIHQWEYINPSDPSQGKQQSATLAPGGAGVNAEPAAIFLRRNLTKAYLIGANLAGAYFPESDLTNADLSQADLTDVDFGQATLANASFAGAEVRGASFWATDLSAAQLYSTASYQAHDLTRVSLWADDLTGWNFAGQNLTGAGLGATKLAGADFTGAEVLDANFEYATPGGFTSFQFYSTASYQDGDLSGIGLAANNLGRWSFAGKNLTRADFSDSNLSGADLSNANLSNADFDSATFTNANLSDAVVRSADFAGTISRGFTAAQLYSTASYQAGNLTGIILQSNDLSSWSFAGQDLSNAQFGFTLLNNVDFSHSRLSGAFFGRSSITGVNLTGADVRGTSFSLNDTGFINTIRDDGKIFGLNLTDMNSLIVRNYAGDPIRSRPPIPVRVEQYLTMDSSGALRMRFDDDVWHSLISFEPGILVALGGTLELDFAVGVDAASQIGRTFRTFDWTGVSPIGQFNIVSPYSWDLSRLYASGEITLIPEPRTGALTILFSVGLFLFRSRPAAPQTVSGLSREIRAKTCVNARLSRSTIVAGSLFVA